MLSTLFFDEEDINVVNVPSVFAAEGLELSHPSGSPSPSSVTAVEQPTITFHGSAVIAEVEATLCWWVAAVPPYTTTSDATGPAAVRSKLHLLLCSNAKSAAAGGTCQSRLLTLGLPYAAQAPHQPQPQADDLARRPTLLACGVSRLAQGGHQLAVTLVLSSLQVGFVQLLAQRGTDATTGVLSLKVVTNAAAAPGERADSPVRFTPVLEEVAYAFQAQQQQQRETRSAEQVRDNSSGVHHHNINNQTNSTALTTTANGGDATVSTFLAPMGPAAVALFQGISACVVAQVPRTAFAERADTIAFLVLSNGAAVWRVKVYGNGDTVQSRMRDPFVQRQKKAAKRSFGGGRDDDTDVAALQVEEVLLDPFCIEKMIAAIEATSAAGASGCGCPCDGDGRRLVSNVQRITPFRNFYVYDQDDDEQADGASDTGSSQNKSWLSRMFGGSAARRGGNSSSLSPSAAATNRKISHLQQLLLTFPYLGVSAVQQSPFFALLRSCGYVQIISAETMQAVDYFPLCRLAKDLLAAIFSSFDEYMENKESLAAAASGHHGRRGFRAERCFDAFLCTQQWAVLDAETNSVQLFTSIGARENRRCAWTSLQQIPRRDELSVALRCCYSVAPPTMTSVPLGCAMTMEEVEVFSDDDDEEAEEEGDEPPAVSITAPARSHRQQNEEDEQEARRGSRCRRRRRDSYVPVYQKRTRLCVLWDRGAEEDGCVEETHTIGSLFTTEQSNSVLQVHDGAISSDDELLWRGSQSFTCSGASLRAVFAIDQTFLVTEGYRGTVRAHVLRLFQDVLQARARQRVGSEWISFLIESTEVEDEAVLEGALWTAPRVSARALHLVPCGHLQLSLACSLAPPDGEAAVDVLAAFHEGLAVLASTGQAASLLRNALSEVLTCSSAMLQLPRALSEAFVRGYVAPETVEERHVLAAARAALQPAAAQPASLAHADALFCGLSRHYVQHEVSRELLHRMAFVLCSYLGWAGAGSVAHSEHPVTVVAQTALQLLAAAYHAVQVAGPDLIYLSVISPTVVDGTTSRVSAAKVVPSLLNVFLPPASSAAALLADPTAQWAAFVVRTAHFLRHSGAAGGAARRAQACTTYAQHLHQRFPLLNHFLVLHELEAQRTSRGTTLRAAAVRVGEVLALRPPSEAAAFLLELGGLPQLSWGLEPAQLPLFNAEVQRLMRLQPAVAAKLYAVGLLRRLVICGATFVECRTSPCVHENYLQVELVQTLRRVGLCEAQLSEASERAFELVRLVLEELRTESALCLAQNHLEDEDVAACCHQLEVVLARCATQRRHATYIALVHRLVAALVERGCGSTVAMNQLLAVSTYSSVLETLLVARWHSYIAGLLTKSASTATETTRRRAILGLHRFLMNRHAYAQCSRVLSDLATLLRCSPQRRASEHYLSIGELATLALHAAEMIHPEAPMVTPAAEAAAAALPALFAVSPVSEGYTFSPQHMDARLAEVRLYTRADIPFLRRRAYQALCERKLGRRGCQLDCSPLWAEGVRPADFRVAVHALLQALMQHRLWEEAFRYAVLCGEDAGAVLCEWAVDLLRYCDAEAAPAIAHSWDVILDGCEELRVVHHDDNAYNRVLSSALFFDYIHTPSKVLEAFERVDRYGAVVALLGISGALQAKAARELPPADTDVTMRVDEEAEAALELYRDRDGVSKADDEAYVNALMYTNATITVGEWRQVYWWLPLVDAARVAATLMKDRGAARTAAAAATAEKPAELHFTTAVLDSLARSCKVLLGKKDALESIAKVYAGEDPKALLEGLLEAI